MFVVSQKLKLLKCELKICNNNVFGNIHNEVAFFAAKLDTIQQEINANGSNETLMHKRNIYFRNLITNYFYNQVILRYF